MEEVIEQIKEETVEKKEVKPKISYLDKLFPEFKDLVIDEPKVQKKEKKQYKVGDEIVLTSISIQTNSYGIRGSSLNKTFRIISGPKKNRHNSENRTWSIEGDGHWTADECDFDYNGGYEVYYGITSPINNPFTSEIITQNSEISKLNKERDVRVNDILSEYNKLVSPLQLKKSELEKKSIKFNNWIKLRSCEEQINLISEICEHIYPDNWYLKFNESNTYCELFIRFPEFEIKNENGLKRTIRNLFCKMTFDWANKFIMTLDLNGGRSTYTLSEWNYAYKHSHLPADSRTSFGKFCLGSTDFSMLNSDLKRGFDKNKFELFLYQMDSYVRAESLAGGPHIRMETINKRNTSIPSLSVSQLEIIYNKFIKESSNFNLNFNSVNGNKIFTVIKTDELEQEIVNYCDSYKCLKSSNSSYYINSERSGELESAQRDAKGRVLISDFNGQKIEIEVIPDEESDIEKTWYPYPQITDYIIKKLNEQLLNYYLNKK